MRQFYEKNSTLTTEVYQEGTNIILQKSLLP